MIPLVIAPQHFLLCPFYHHLHRMVNELPVNNNSLVV